MSWVAGVDGCRGGWFRVARNTSSGELDFAIVEQATDLIALEPAPSIIAIDIPIGLPDAGARECDVAARRILGERRNSVFPSPVRAALSARSREEASAITQAIDGRRVSAQAWAIFSKIREVDTFLQESDTARRRIFEIHPEVCFRAWSGGEPMSENKKSRVGRQERRVLADQWLGIDTLRIARGDYLKKHLADDDILDAVAAAWTATREIEGQAERLPEAPIADSTGLPMQMVY